MMVNATTFDEVLDAIEHLPEEQQADLVGVVRRRLAERRRQRIIRDAREARQSMQPARLAQYQWTT